MGSILDRYGIKEVADVTFYDIKSDGTPGAPVLHCDSLKVSTVEQSAETVYAQGGKGNPRLIGWDFGKEITLNIQDALFSPKSMALMMGNGTVGTGTTQLKKTIAFKATTTSTTTGAPTQWTDADGTKVAISGAVFTDGAGATVTSFTSGETYYATFNVPVENTSEITIGPDTFPGTYYITGDTYCRSEITGDDEHFQFIIAKGKIKVENTITMEADGDPSVFDMNVDVLRAKNAAGEPEMMKLIKYSVGK